MSDGVGGGIVGGVNSLLFGNKPNTPDFMKLADKTTQANRPDQTTPFGSSRWTQDANGNWSQSTSFDPKLSGAADSLMTQWGKNAANGYGTGDDARRQAVDAEWGQFQRMNNPLMDQRENKSRSDLLNMGLDAGSDAYNTGFGNVRTANDKQRLNAMDQAVMAGDRAQGQTFNQNRQAWSDPLNALGTMQGLLQMPGFKNGADYGGAGQQQYGAEMGRYNQNKQDFTDLVNGATDVGKLAFGMPPGMGGSGAGSGVGWGGQNLGKGPVVNDPHGNFGDFNYGP